MATESYFRLQSDRVNKKRENRNRSYNKRPDRLAICVFCFLTWLDRNNKKQMKLDHLIVETETTYGKGSNYNHDEFGKENPFLSPRTNVGTNQSIVGAKTDQKTKGPELNAILDVALEQFKCSKENDNNTFLNLQDENQTSTATTISQESQIQDFGGLYGKSLAPKGVVVLGGDPKPKQSRCEKPFIKGEKPLPVYNHYASGSGWWDSDMEGIDNDEVGFNEVWEGVGSATMGGLDWH
ncbi:uncharacterized protein [Rutidosis leptorrhynchoides]|uniref:uncharacterized protein n=1 Tax=Rutidosis leptorrhynchoides TaxID=125765 RepID=UPI003A992510